MSTSKTVLVTGGAGYIGSHTCKTLAAAGYLPVTYDSLEYGHADAVRWGPLEHGSITNEFRLQQVFEQYQPSAVLHFAAYAYVGESVIDPARYYRNNVSGSLALLQTMRAAGCQRLVFSSTCATYGHPQTPSISEDHPQIPVNPYGWSKLMVERILADYATAYGLRYAALRYFNAAGADADCEIGEYHTPETHLVPLAITAALGGEPVRVFGSDYDTPDGTAIRDYIHVTDLALAHVAALRHLEQHEQCVCLNLGTGQGYSVRDVITSVERVTARKVPFNLAPRRAGDPARLVADAQRGMQELNWRPARPCLDDIIASAWRWHLSRHTGDR